MAESGFTTASFELDNALQEINAQDLELVYLHPVLEPTRVREKRESASNLDFLDLKLACGYIDAIPASELTIDQLEEFLECFDLVVRNDSAFVHWCGRQSTKRQILWNHWRNGDSTTLPSDLRSVLGRAFLETRETELTRPITILNSEVLTNHIVRLSGMVEIALPEPGGAVGKGILGKILDCNDPAQFINFSLECPTWWEPQDVTLLKCRLAGVPALMFGRLNSKHQLNVYAASIFPDAYRTSQSYASYHLRIAVVHAKSQLNPRYSWGQRFGLGANNEGRQREFEQAIDMMRKAQALNDFSSGVEALCRVWDLVHPSDPEPIPFGRLGELASINGITLLSIVLHAICWLTLEDSPSALLSRLHAELGLSCPKSGRADRDNQIGCDIALILTDQTTDSCLALSGSGQILRYERGLVDYIERFRVELPIRSTPNCLATLQKHIPKEWPDYGGDARVGNPLSCVAFASVGARWRKEIVSPQRGPVINGGILSGAAVLIPLENRHQRTARLPEPWLGNLRKLQQVITNNPNIRHLVIFGEQGICETTIGYLRNWRKDQQLRDLPPEYFQDELVARFLAQIDPATFQVIYTDDVSDTELIWILKRIVESSYLSRTDNDDVAAIRDAPCMLSIFPSSFLSPESSQDRQPLLQGLDAVEARGQTAAKAYVRAVEAVRCFGMTKKTDDEMGRFYRELLSFRIVVENPGAEQTPLGFDENELLENFRGQWLGEGYSKEGAAPFYERMHMTFGIDQVNHVIELIAGCIRDLKVSRGILINVHHAKVDQKRSLGLNTIHYTLELADLGAWVLHASYIWRTVDVLSGLPFNIHAAALFLCHIVDLCNERLGDSVRLNVGEMMIVALNLHLYEGFDCVIARQLVERSEKVGLL